jgi:hypothetical protein
MDDYNNPHNNHILDDNYYTDHNNFFFNHDLVINNFVLSHNPSHIFYSTIKNKNYANLFIYHKYRLLYNLDLDCASFNHKN